MSILLELPQILSKDQEDEAVKKRLYPEPEDEDDKEEWKRLVHPELFALIADARTIVTRDLGGLVPSDTEDPLGTWEMRIPKEHVQAWISALNAARLALGAKHGIEEEDMAHEELDDDEWDDKRLAITKIHLMGWLQQLIIEDYNPPEGGLEIPDFLPPDLG